MMMECTQEENLSFISTVFRVSWGFIFQKCTLSKNSSRTSLAARLNDRIVKKKYLQDFMDDFTIMIRI